MSERPSRLLRERVHARRYRPEPAGATLELDPSAKPLVLPPELVGLAVESLLSGNGMANHSRARGERGATGERGPRGERGATGQRGPAGPKATRADILAVVEDQFSEVRKQLETQRNQLDLQLTRFGQLQQQLDQIHTLIKQLVAES